jgi:5-formyltetrahydrofolate cyclo-ligase
MATPPPGTTKAHVRAAHRAARAHSGPTDTDHVIHALAQILPPPPTGVAVYRSYGHEPRTHELISSLLAQGRLVVSPRMTTNTDSGEHQRADSVHSESVRIEWVPVTESTSWVPGFRGIEEPTGSPASLDNVQAIIIPALAATITGERLGQGGGHYDRALEHVPRHAEGGPLLIGLVFEDEVYEHAEWPVEQHDVHLDIVVHVQRCLGSPESKSQGCST